MPEALARQLDSALAGDRGALARLISVLERGGSDAACIERYLRVRPGSSYTVGVTGAPGAGKSTLVSMLLGEILAETSQVALLAVDPSSPLTRGALLGDRVRMQAHTASPDVFIRSMASRGHQGGLALATRSARRLLETCGWPLTLIETVGVGQVELDVASATDTVVVVLNPGWGDEVQANKAGLMEVADIFVINKADKAGLESTRRDLEGALASLPPERRPQVLETIATEGKGAAALWQAIKDHRAAITASGELKQRRLAQVRSELKGMVDAALADRIQRVFASAESEARLLAVSDGSLDLAEASEEILALLYDGSARDRSL